MIEFGKFRTTDLQVGTKLLLGIAGKEPILVAVITRLTKTQIVLQRPDTLNERRYERRTGCEVGNRGLGLRIKGIATPEEVLVIEQKLAEKRRSIEEGLRVQEESNRKRIELAGLFPGGYVALVSTDMDHPGKWVLTLENLSELDLEDLADYMQNPDFRP